MVCARIILSPPPPQDLIVFDGVCVLCNRFVRFVHRFDRAGAFGFATAQSPVGQDCYRKMDLPGDTLETVLVFRQGEGFAKSAAVLVVVTGFGGAWRLAGLGWVVPRVLRDWCYDRVARNRFRLFGRLDACPMPEPALRARFVEGGFIQ